MFLLKSFPVHFCPFKGKSRPRANFVPFLPNTGEKAKVVAAVWGMNFSQLLYMPN